MKYIWFDHGEMTTVQPDETLEIGLNGWVTLTEADGHWFAWPPHRIQYIEGFGEDPDA